MSEIPYSAVGKIANPRWVFPQRAGQGYGVSAQVGTANRVWLCPIYLPKAAVLSNLSTEIAIAGGVGTSLRLGLYADNGGTPVGAAVLVQSGNIAADSAVVKSFTFTPITVPAGYVWAALETADATIQFRRFSTIALWNEVGSEMTKGCFYDRGSFGDLTSPCPAVTSSLAASFAAALRVDAFVGDK